MADGTVTGSADASPSSGEAYWREQVAAWKASGVSQTRFCREHGLSRFRFGTWKIRIDGRDARGGARLVRLGTTKLEAVGSGGLRLWVGGRYSVEVPKRFDVETLSRLLEVLEGR